MHELSIASSALELVFEHARRENATRVQRVILCVGELSGVDLGALRFAFTVASTDTLAENAALEIEVVPALAHCAACDEDFAAAGSFIFACPTCGELSSDVHQGLELDLARIEMTT